IAVAPSDPNVIYAVFGRCASEAWPCTTAPEIYRTLNGGATWTRAAAVASGSDPFFTYSRYTHLLTVNPAFPRIVSYGGLRLWQSQDYGETFQIPIGGLTPHLDQHDLVYPNLTN